ncbi:MAG: hypothetical protein RMJ37_06770 [Spirochaetia bacterium]|nr:hypothetical protein [Spirochaetota bacterium]MCX8096176.1 hypothetical protein [Spirochaetota bacterium]MDW8113018.1 hypothetical protein [Spirochaetia bacterium]
MKGIRVYDNTKIYVVAPSNLITGGPEQLHAIAHHLKRDLEIESYIYYLPPKLDAVPEPYKDYGVALSKTIEDEEKNIIIVPEIPKFIEFANRYSKIRKVIYWLSVDFFYQFLFYRTLRGILMAIVNRINLITIEKINKALLPHFDIPSIALKEFEKIDLKNSSMISKVYFHLTQSVRSSEHLKSKGIENTFCVFDYINRSFLVETFDERSKENIVCYNPKKGFEFTSKLIKYSSTYNRSIKFVPIIGLDRRGVIELLKRSKVYIDFGSFPGKERIPREAIMLGCCVITGRRGSARYFEDVPVPDEYKFEDKVENIPLILDKIQDCLNNYESHLRNFDYSRELIRREPEDFVNRLRQVFVKE